jgi:hypothetical protein
MFMRCIVKENTPIKTSGTNINGVRQKIISEFGLTYQ